MKNRENEVAKQLANIFNKIADALEFKSEIPFKIIAYRKAARVLNDLTEDIEVLWEENKLRTIPGVGEGIAKKIDEYLKTGKMRKYEEALKNIPSGLLSLLNIQSMGPKTLRLAHNKLGVNSKGDLEKVIEDGSLAKLPNMGERKVENIKKGLKIFSAQEKRISIGVALPLVENVINWIKKGAVAAPISSERIEPAGSLRRMKETIGDIDILCTPTYHLSGRGKNGTKIIEHFTNFPETSRILAKGETKGSIIVNQRYQIDLRVVKEECFGAALQYFTGSKSHNIKLRSIAKEKGLKISEYGVFDGAKKIAGEKEEEVYSILGLPYIPPELREDRGEIELKTIPELINYGDIKGDLHIHSRYSDGQNSIKEIAEFAKNMDYEYIAITEHSKSAKYAGGIDEKILEQEIEEIEQVEKECGIRIFKGIELEILNPLANGLDFDDKILEKLDIVIGAVHTSSKKDMTEAICAACCNSNVDIIAHPTGRLISRREGYKIDISKVIEKAASTNTALEINAYYDRLDLSDINARKAKENGVKIVINSDAHSTVMLKSMRFGIGVARRAWLSKGDILNTLSVEELEDWFKNHKR